MQNEHSCVNQHSYQKPTHGSHILCPSEDFTSAQDMQNKAEGDFRAATALMSMKCAI